MATKSLKFSLLIFGILALVASSFAQVPTATVSIYSYTPSGNLIATATLDANGNYTVNSAALTTTVNAGIPVYAVYNGDSGNAGSTSPEVIDVINAAVQCPTSTSLVIVPNPGTVGASQTFSGAVTPSCPSQPSAAK